MENLLEWLVPLIFAAIYFFGNMLSGKSGEEERPQPKRRPGEAYEETDADRQYAERQRQIQAEIRRKIQERRQAASGQPTAAEPAQAATPPPLSERAESEQVGRRATHERTKERKEKHKETREAVHETAPHLHPTHEAEPQTASGDFSWDQSDNAYEQAMEAQLKQIEATKRQAAALRQKAEASRKKTGSRKHRSHTGGAFLSGPVREHLKNPAAARAAFVYGEVLGQPVSLRKGEKLPGLS